MIPTVAIAFSLVGLALMIFAVIINPRLPTIQVLAP